MLHSSGPLWILGTARTAGRPAKYLRFRNRKNLAVLKPRFGTAGSPTHNTFVVLCCSIQSRCPRFDLLDLLCHYPTRALMTGSGGLSKVFQESSLLAIFGVWSMIVIRYRLDATFGVTSDQWRAQVVCCPGRNLKISGSAAPPLTQIEPERQPKKRSQEAETAAPKGF